jgi:hypothetical protein
MLVSTSASGWIINRRRAVSCCRGRLHMADADRFRVLEAADARVLAGCRAHTCRATRLVPPRAVSLARPRARHVVGAPSPGGLDDWAPACRGAAERTTWPPCVRPPLHRPRPVRSIAVVRIHHDAKNNDTRGGRQTDRVKSLSFFFPLRATG